MLYLLIAAFLAIVLYYTMKGELQYVRDNLEIQLRQARFRLDRLEQRVRDLEKTTETESKPAAETATSNEEVASNTKAEKHTAIPASEA